jgi:hypothetical protein
MLETQVWAKEVAEILIPDNSFMVRSVDDTAFIEQNAEGEMSNRVWLPQAGIIETVYDAYPPETPVERADNGDWYYDLKAHRTKPIKVPREKQMMYSYDVRASVNQAAADALDTQIAARVMYEWAPTASQPLLYVRTSGANRAAILTGATGTRKKVTYADIVMTLRILTAQNVKTDKLCILVPSEMYYDLLEIPEFIDASKFGGSAVLPTGALGKILGMNVYMRSTTLSYTNAATPVKKEPGAASAVTDNAAALVWHESFVRRAKGMVKVFYNPSNARSFSDEMSFEAFVGAKASYADYKGTAVIIESAGA